MGRLSVFALLGVLVALSLLWALPAHAATFTVTKTADTNDGTCDADCSLREAIIAANANLGADSVTVPAGTYVLTIIGTNENASATGDLDVTDDLTLMGAGATTTFIDGAAADSVIDVRGSATLDISNVTVQNAGHLRDGILSFGGTLIVTGCTIRNIPNNGIRNENGGALTLTNSTISGSSIGINNFGTVDVVSSTISENDVGIFTQVGTANITNSTISQNRVRGVVSGISAVTTLTSTIVAMHPGGNCDSSQGILISNGYNLDDDGSCGLTGTGDLSNVPDAGLLLLADNGGPTQTVALSGDSPALDAGNNAACPATDQRGVARPVNGTCDIGAFEGPPCFQVPDGSRCDDDSVFCNSIGSCSAGTCSVVPGFRPAFTPCTDGGLCWGFCDGAGACAPSVQASEPCFFDQDCTEQAVCVDNECLPSCLPPCEDSFCLGLVCILPSLSGTCPETPESPSVDHFKCWKVKDLKIPAKFEKIKDPGISLDDQFLAEADVQVKKPRLICNPADKNGEGISDPSAHMCCYRIKGQKLLTPKQFEIEDQFEQTLTLQAKGRARLLCQPCTKTDLP